MKVYEVIQNYRDYIIVDRLGREITKLPTDILMYKNVLDCILEPYQCRMKIIVDYTLPIYDPTYKQPIKRIIQYLETLFNSSSEDQAALLNQAIRNLEEYVNDTRTN